MERRCNSQVIKFKARPQTVFGVGTTFNIMHHHKFTHIMNKNRIHKIDPKPDKKMPTTENSPFLVKTIKGVHQGTIEIPSSSPRRINTRSGFL